MSYRVIELSVERGAPVELYEFAQKTKRWTYASSADAVTHNHITYTPLPIARDRIKQTNDIFKDSLKLKFPRSNAFASQFLGFAPDDVTTVTVLRGHQGDAEFILYWKGRVVGARAASNEITIECESVFTSVRRPGLRARFEYSCRHALYSGNCGVSQASHKHDGTVNSVVGGLQVHIAAAATQPDGYLTGGMLITNDGTARFLTKHAGEVVTLSRPIHTPLLGQEVSIYPGCDHLRGTCNAKFNNLDNFGGFPFIPKRNPFDGSSIV